MLWSISAIVIAVAGLVVARKRARHASTLLLAYILIILAYVVMRHAWFTPELVAGQDMGAGWQVTEFRRESDSARMIVKKTDSGAVFVRHSNGSLSWRFFRAGLKSSDERHSRFITWLEDIGLPMEAAARLDLSNPTPILLLIPISLVTVVVATVGLRRRPAADPAGT